MPHFMANQPGMQSFEELDPQRLSLAQGEWIRLAEYTRGQVRALMDLKVHKQWANRPLEWFGFIDVLVTSTDWTNWDALRNHKDAMPEIRELAREIEILRLDSVPMRRSFYSDINGWHLPYITEDERYAMRADDLCKISAARCARISYKPFDADEPNAEADLKLFDKLMGAQPLHASPAEHQAIPDMQTEWSDGRGNSTRTWMQADQHGNFYGWRQFRKTLQGECVRDEHYDF